MLPEMKLVRPLQWAAMNEFVFVNNNHLLTVMKHWKHGQLTVKSDRPVHWTIQFFYFLSNEKYRLHGVNAIALSTIA